MNNVAHFPLEISQDNGGVSALLPSGQILVDKRGSDKISEGGGGVNESNSMEEEESRYSYTPEYAGSPKQAREEPSPLEQQQKSSEDEGVPTSSNSSASEDRTFNSLPSDLSSMMSNLEIQRLLKQGREMVVYDDDGRPLDMDEGGRGHPQIMELYSNQNIYHAPSRDGTMALYSNQNLYHAPSSESRGNGHGSQDFYQQLQTAPSSTSHCLHRTDAMDDASKSDELRPPVPLSPLQEQQSFQDIQNAAPLSSASSVVVVEDTREGDSGEVEVEVVSLNNTDNSSADELGEVSLPSRKSVQSLLGASTKSLIDDLIFQDSEEEDGEEREADEEDKNGNDSASDGSPSNNIYENEGMASAALLKWNTIREPISQVPLSQETSPGGDDGYSADRSNYTSNDGIEECSTGVNSYGGLELKQAPPMPIKNENDTEDDSQHQNYGYGHAYDHEQVPRHAYEYSKPFISPIFPSLMDSSVSSALTASTVHSVARKRLDSVEREEREDSLPPLITHDQRGVLQKDAISQQGVTPDPLMVTTSTVMQNNNRPAVIDPRMDVDCERRYIVDLERINEESSGNNDLLSPGTQAYTSSTASSKSSAAAEVSNGVGPATAKWLEKLEAAEDAAAVAANGRTTTDVRADNAIPDGRGQLLQPLNSHQPTQFYDYRHQYYTEQYHYCDDRFSQAPKCDDEVDSTCSSVTLSQAFQQLDDSESCSSSIATDELSASQYSSHTLMSTVSSVTLSHALSVERHDHSDQGFYVATRLGDFVAVPNERGDPGAAAALNVDPNEGEEDVQNTDNRTDGKFDVNSETSPNSAEGKDALSNTAVTSTNVASGAEDFESDILSALVPECGVPIPSVMAKVGGSKSRSSRGGMLLPWHSTRSIQNYHGRRGGKKKRDGGNTSSSASIFSMSSVHTFRG